MNQTTGLITVNMEYLVLLEHLRAAGYARSEHNRQLWQRVDNFQTLQEILIDIPGNKVRMFTNPGGKMEVSLRSAVAMGERGEL
jgi:hypothetical protein